MYKFKNYQGFTLIELLVVVAIIGLLAILVLVNVGDIRAKSRDTSRVADIKSIQEGLDMYQLNHSEYPTYDGFITGADDMSNAIVGDELMSMVPVDPLDRDMNGITYKYHYLSADGTVYTIEYYLETDSVLGKPAGFNVAIP